MQMGALLLGLLRVCSLPRNAGLQERCRSRVITALLQRPTPLSWTLSRRPQWHAWCVGAVVYGSQMHAAAAKLG